jgi:hypothetical protein
MVTPETPITQAERDLIEIRKQYEVCDGGPDCKKHPMTESEKRALDGDR